MKNNSKKNVSSPKKTKNSPPKTNKINESLKGSAFFTLSFKKSKVLSSNSPKKETPTIDTNQIDENNNDQNNNNNLNNNQNNNNINSINNSQSPNLNGKLYGTVWYKGESSYLKSQVQYYGYGRNNVVFNSTQNNAGKNQSPMTKSRSFNSVNSPHLQHCNSSSSISTNGLTTPTSATTPLTSSPFLGGVEPSSIANRIKFFNAVSQEQQDLQDSYNSGGPRRNGVKSPQQSYYNHKNNNNGNNISHQRQSSYNSATMDFEELKLEDDTTNNNNNLTQQFNSNRYRNFNAFDDNTSTFSDTSTTTTSTWSRSSRPLPPIPLHQQPYDSTITTNFSNTSSISNTPCSTAPSTPIHKRSSTSFTPNNELSKSRNSLNLSIGGFKEHAPIQVARENPHSSSSGKPPIMITSEAGDRSSGNFTKPSLISSRSISGDELSCQLFNSTSGNSSIHSDNSGVSTDDELVPISSNAIDNVEDEINIDNTKDTNENNKTDRTINDNIVNNINNDYNNNTTNLTQEEAINIVNNNNDNNTTKIENTNTINLNNNNENEGPIQTDEYMISSILNELFMTEEVYERDLEFIMKMVDDLRSRGFEKSTLVNIFSNIEIIRNISKTILSDLNQPGGNTLHNTVVVFKNLNAFLKMYSQYCTHHLKSLETVSELTKTNPQFNQFVNDILSNPLCRGLRIQDYLIKPIQRICKYPLFFSELLRFTPKSDPDYKQLEEVYDKLIQVASFINQHQKVRDQNERLLEIQNIIEGVPFQILESTRQIVREAFVRIREVGKEDYHTRYLFLFNDTILYTKSSAFSKKFQFSFSIPLFTAKLMDSLPSESKSILLAGYNGESEAFLVETQFDSEREREEFYKLLTQLIAENKSNIERMKQRVGSPDITSEPSRVISADPTDPSVLLSQILMQNHRRHKNEPLSPILLQPGSIGTLPKLTTTSSSNLSLSSASIPPPPISVSSSSFFLPPSNNNETTDFDTNNQLNGSQESIFEPPPGAIMMGPMSTSNLNLQSVSYDNLSKSMTPTTTSAPSTPTSIKQQPGTLRLKKGLTSSLINVFDQEIFPINISKKKKKPNH